MSPLRTEIRKLAGLEIPVAAAAFFNLIGYWLLGIPIGAWLAFRAGLGLLKPHHARVKRGAVLESDECPGVRRSESTVEPPEHGATLWSMSPPVRYAVVMLALALLAPKAAAQTLTALGPAPRDEDGRFLNQVGPITRAGPTVTIPFFLRRAAGVFRGRRGAPERTANDGAFLRANAGHSVPTVTWVGHATLLVQMGHRSFLTDPTWSKTASPLPFAGPRRFVPPGIALDDLPPIDFVLISHNHYDHLDIGTLRELATRRPETRFFVPLGNGKLLRDAGIENIEELDWGASRMLGALTIHCLPSQHWSRRGLFDARRALWASWAVIGADRRFYFGGDTGYFAGFEAIGGAVGPFDLAALPIGAYRPEAMMRVFHLDPEEAVWAGLDLQARHLLGMHFGTFDLTDEPLDEPPTRFRAAGARAGLPDQRIWVLKVGETRRF